MKGRVIGRIIRYRGKRVRVVEEATGFIRGPRQYWVRAREQVAGFEPGEEFTVSARHIMDQLRRNI